MTAGKLLEIVIDKGLLAVVVVVFGFICNKALERFKEQQAETLEAYKTEQTKTVEAYRAEQTKAIEAFKAEQTKAIAEYQAEQAKALAVHTSELEQKRKDREKRAEAIETILAANNDMFYVLSAAARKEYQVTDQDYDRYIKAMTAIQTTHTRYQTLFTDTFTQELERYLRVHVGFSHQRLKGGEEVFPFFQDLSRRFSRVCELEAGKIARLPDGDFAPLGWDTQKMNEAGSPKYFRQNYEEWQRWRQGGKK